MEVNSLNERIRMVRDKLNLTRAAFGGELGVSGDVINNLERGRVEAKEPIVKLICSVYSVDEGWLRTGKGEMFVELPKNEALAAQIQNFLQSGTDSFRERLVSLLLRLTPEQWDALEGYLLELTALREAAPASTDDDIDQDVENYRHRRLLEKNQGEKSSPSSEGGTETA